MPESLDPLNTIYSRLFAHLMLAYADLRLIADGLLEFLKSHNLASAEDLDSYLAAYHEHHEHQMREQIIRWFHEDPERIDPDELFGSSSPPEG